VAKAGCVAVLALLALAAPAVASAPLGVVETYTKGFRPEAAPGLLAPGPDGELWFTDWPEYLTERKAAIGRVTTSGAISEETLPIGGRIAFGGLTAGPDGNMWFTISAYGYEYSGYNSAIGRITPSGVVTYFQSYFREGPDKESEPKAITIGSDGSLWFAEDGAIPAVGRVTTSGHIEEFPGAIPAGCAPLGMVSGSDGNLWFVLEADNRHGPCSTPGIERFSPITHMAKIFAEGLPSGQLEAAFLGPDGDVWFSSNGENGPTFVSRVDVNGDISEALTVPSTRSRGGSGPDGAYWTALDGWDGPGRSQIDNILPPFVGGDAGVGLGFALAGNASGPLVAGPDGNMWLIAHGTSEEPEVVRVGTGAPAAPSVPPAVVGPGVVGSELACQVRWPDWDEQQPSASLYPLDGYSWRLDGNPIPGATSIAYTPGPADVGHELACAVTATYPRLNVTESAVSDPVTVFPASPRPGPSETPKWASASPPRSVPSLPRVDTKATWRFSHTGRYTTVKSLVLHDVPEEANIEVSCDGRGCPPGGSHLATVAATRRCRLGKPCASQAPVQKPPTISLAYLFRGHRLAPRATISVRVVESGWIGKSYVFGTHRQSKPSVQIACLAPAATQPGVGC
jgi:virginiamycin B lyase